MYFISLFDIFMSEINKTNSVEISKKVTDLVSDGALNVLESQELIDIFEKNKRNTIVISQEALRELRKTIGSSRTDDYITDSEKEIIKNIKGTTTQYTYWQSELFTKSLDYVRGAEKHMPQDLRAFLDKYYAESLIYAGNKQSLVDNQLHGGILNVWSHKYMSQMVATWVFEWLPKSMNKNFRYAISTMVAASSMYAKEQLDVNVTKEDIFVPFFYDLWDGNSIFFTYAPGWSLNIDFNLSNIEALNKKAENYLRYVNGEIIQNKWDKNHKKYELRVDVWFWIQNWWDIHMTSKKSPNNIATNNNGNYTWNQVNIITYADEMLSAKLWNSGKSTVRWTIWVQKDKTGNTVIVWATSHSIIDTNSGRFWADIGIMTAGSAGAMIWGTYGLPDYWVSMDISQRSKYLDTQTHTYMSGIKVDWEVTLWWVQWWAQLLNGQASYDGINYGQRWQVIWATVGFDTKWWDTPIGQTVRDALWWADLSAKGQAFTNNSLGLDVNINKKSWDITGWLGMYVWKWNPSWWSEGAWSSISAYLEKDIMGLFDTFGNPELHDKEKLQLLLTLKQKYKLDISENEIKQLWPINGLRAFAIANKDIVNNNILINLWFSIKGWKIILPSDFIWDKNKLDNTAQSIIKLSIWGKLWIVDTNNKVWFWTELFTKLDVQLDNNTTIEYLAYKDWTHAIINRLSYVQNITKDSSGNITWFVLVTENQNGLSWAGVWVNMMEKSGNGDRFTVTVMQNGGISMSWGSKSIVFWDINNEMSLNIWTFLPIISTIVTENTGNNVTNEWWEVFASYENVFQSVTKDRESREVVEKISKKLHILWQVVGLEFDNAIVSQFSKTEKLKAFDDWLDKNTQFILDNKSKIRYIKFSNWAEKNSTYDDITKILNCNITLWGDWKLLNENNIKAKQYDYYISSDKPEEINARITLSNTLVLEYLWRMNNKFQSHKDILIECFRNIEIIWFETLSDIEKEWLMDLILRMIKNGTISKLRYKRLIISDDSLFNFSISLNSWVKTLSLERQVLWNIWASNLDYSIDSNDSAIRLRIKEWELAWLFTGLSKENQEKIKKSFSDMSEFQILPDNDVRLLCKKYIWDNWKLYLSESFFKKIKSGKVDFNELMRVCLKAKVGYLHELDNEIDTKFWNDEAKIIKLTRSAGENTFYEFRPTTDIQTTDGTKKVKYDVFDHGNERMNSFEVQLTKENDIKIIIQGKLYDMDNIEFQMKYRYMLQALIGMTGRTKTGETQSIWWIIDMLLSSK